VEFRPDPGRVVAPDGHRHLHHRKEAEVTNDRRTGKGLAGPRCPGTTKAGNPCKNPAGAKTDHLGHGRCANHGGNGPGPRIQGIRGASAEAADKFALSDEMQIGPEDALLWAVRLPVP
jgi:hypothetical protein